MLYLDKDIDIKKLYSEFRFNELLYFISNLTRTNIISKDIVLNEEKKYNYLTEKEQKKQSYALNYYLIFLSELMTKVDNINDNILLI
jgi:hypothetical protein